MSPKELENQEFKERLENLVSFACAKSIDIEGFFIRSKLMIKRLILFFICGIF